jgi:alcohol dehydrogenase class IV
MKAMRVEDMKDEWSYPTSIRFGVGRVSELPDICIQLGMKKPLFVSDRDLAKLPMVENAMARLKESGLSVVLFSDLNPNPALSDVVKGVSDYKDGLHDGVIAFGGGSSLDVVAINGREMENEFTAVARYLALRNPSSRALVDWLMDLRHEIGIPHKTSELGNSKEHIPHPETIEFTGFRLQFIPHLMRGRNDRKEHFPTFYESIILLF